MILEEHPVTAFLSSTYIQLGESSETASAMRRVL